MTDTAVRAGTELTLSARGPAYSVIQRCLELQESAPPRGPVARFFGVTPLLPDARSWYRGAIGEIEVARALTKLGPDWTVLHAVPIGSGEADIDHVVIGPAGVFTLNAKNHAGKRVFVGGRSFIVNGFKQPHVRNAEFEAKRASVMLSDALGVEIPVTPVIVVVGAESIAVGSTQPAVEVRSSGQIARWLRKQREILPIDAVARIARVAARRGTWHVESVVLNDTQRHVLRFERLQKQVDAAAHRQRLLVAAATLVGLLALVAVLNQFLTAMSATR